MRKLNRASQILERPPKANTPRIKMPTLVSALVNRVPHFVLVSFMFRVVVMRSPHAPRIRMPVAIKLLEVFVEVFVEAPRARVMLVVFVLKMLLTRSYQRIKGHICEHWHKE